MTRTVALAVCAVLAAAVPEPARAALGRAARPPRPASAALALAQPRDAMRLELGRASSWLAAPLDGADPERLRARLAALALADGPPSAAVREALAAEWPAELLAAYDGLLASVAREEIPASALREARAALELAALRSPGAAESGAAFDGTAAAAALEGHVVVAGAGPVGTRVVDLLWRLGRPAALLSKGLAPETRRRLERRGVPVVEGKPGEDDLLSRVNLSRAAALVTTEEDAGALSLVLDARRLAPEVPVISAVSSLQLARQLESSLGVRWAANAAAIAAPVFAASVFGERMKAEFRLDGRRFVAGYLEAARFAAAPATVGEASARGGFAVLAVRDAGRFLPAPGPATPLQGREDLLVAMPEAAWHALHGNAPTRTGQAASFALRTLYRLAGVSSPARRILAALAAVAAFSMVFFHLTLGLSPVDAFYFVMSTITTTGYGDINLLNAPTFVKIYGGVVMLSGAVLLSLLSNLVRSWMSESKTRAPRHPVLLGGHAIVAVAGALGHRVVREILKRGGKAVFVESAAGGEVGELLEDEVPVVAGDPARAAVLEKAKIGGAAAVVVARESDDDGVNAALVARTLNRKARLILGASDPDLARDMRGRMGLDAVHSEAALVAPALVGRAVDPDAALVMTAGGHLFRVHERVADEPLGPGAVALPLPGRGRVELTVERLRDL